MTADIAGFLDTNVIFYLLDDGPKPDRAAQILSAGGQISVQLVNETLASFIRKTGMRWERQPTSLSALCAVGALTAEAHAGWEQDRHPIL